MRFNDVVWFLEGMCKWCCVKVGLLSIVFWVDLEIRVRFMRIVLEFDDFFVCIEKLIEFYFFLVVDLEVVVGI